MAKQPAPVMEPITAFSVSDGQLVVGGVPLRKLANRLGGTPFYAYDRHLISDRVAYLRRYLPNEVNIHYAMKANPMPAVVQHLATLVDGIDVASANEMNVALDTIMPADRISFAGPGKIETELSSAVAADIVVNVESEREVKTIARLGRIQGVRPKIAVRVNPDFALKASGMRMGGGGQQFGVDAERVPALIRVIERHSLDLVGFHIFAGSQNLHSDLIIDAETRSVDLALALARHSPDKIQHINIGGGFGIPYFPGDCPLNLEPIGRALHALQTKVSKVLPGVRLVIELGRYLVGEAGIYVCRVVERKKSRGELFLITDGGLHHHLAATGNFGQVIRRNYPVAVGTRMNDNRREVVNVVGPLCTPLDVLGAKVTLPPAKVGDLIVIFQSGAYGFTASPRGFLSHPSPREALV